MRKSLLSYPILFALAILFNGSAHAQLYLTPDGRIINQNGSYQGRMSPAEMQGINRTPPSGQIWVNPSNGATVNGNGNYLGGPNPALRNCLSRGYGC